MRGGLDIWSHDVGMDSDVGKVVTSFPVLILEEGCLHARLNDPVASLAGISLWSLHLLESLVQGQVVSDGVVPSLLGVFAIV